MDDWEISFNLRAAERSEPFNFSVNSVKSPDKPFPSFPKAKFLRALKTHSAEKKYKLHRGILADLQFKNTSEYDNTQEIHVIMLVFEKMGPVSLIFRESFSYLTLEAIDSQYNYIGHDALLNVLIQIIKPDSPTIKGLGKIKTVYYASNEKEKIKKETFVSFLDSTEGKVFAFSLSVILPTVVIIALPLDLLESMIGYILCLGLLTILWCIYPIAKRSTKHAPLALISATLSYLIIEILIHLNFLLSGINPWGIFNNISRQDLIGILQRQDLISDLGNQVGFGLSFLSTIIPFFDILIIIFIPFTIGLGCAGLIGKFDMSIWKSIVVRTFFFVLLISTLITIPMSYHMLGKGSEGTLHASIGIIKTAEMFTPKYLESLSDPLIFDELLDLISLAQDHLLKSGNSFLQFGQNPLITYLLPFLIPRVAGIPLADLPNILALTNVVADTLEYFPNILWAFNHLTEGLNQSFDILMATIPGINLEGVGSATFQAYDSQMAVALSLMQKGANNLTYAQPYLMELIDQVQERLDYSIFAEISDLLTTIEVGLPILNIILSSAIPWINSTYKLALTLDEFYDFNFNPESLDSAKADFNASQGLSNINIEGLPTNTLIPITDLVNFSQNLHEVTKNLIFSVENATYTFQALNGTLVNFNDIEFDNTSNIDDPVWSNIDIGLQNTSNYLNLTRASLDQMSQVIEAQKALEFEEITELNTFIDNLDNFTQDASDRFDVINDYFNALNASYWSMQYFSLGSNSLNQSITAEILAPATAFDASQADANFTQCQISANLTENILSGISDHLLNQSAVDDWSNLIRGDITNSSINSVYWNAQECRNIIAGISASEAAIGAYYLDFQDVLDQLELLDWNVFSSIG